MKQRIRWVAASSVVLLLLPHLGGLLVAMALYLLLPRVVGALPTARAQRRAAEDGDQVLLLAEALAAHLHAGVPLLESLDSCADVGELGEATRACAELIRIGSQEPFAPWQRWDLLAPMTRELSRALRNGSGLSGSARRAAQHMREYASRKRRIEVERVSVRITMPIALCLLPAFLLLAVVPPTLGILTQLDITP